MNPDDLSAQNWHPQPPALALAVQKLRAESGLDLPADYLAFFGQSNGGEGELGGGWVSLWPVQEVLQLNRDYEIQRWAPGFFGIGSDGGDKALVFDVRAPKPWKIYTMPFGSLVGEDAVLIAESFALFIEKLKRKQ